MPNKKNVFIISNNEQIIFTSKKNIIDISLPQLTVIGVIASVFHNRQCWNCLNCVTVTNGANISAFLLSIEQSTHGYCVGITVKKIDRFWSFVITTTSNKYRCFTVQTNLEVNVPSIYTLFVYDYAYMHFLHVQDNCVFSKPLKPFFCFANQIKT